MELSFFPGADPEGGPANIPTKIFFASIFNRMGNDNNNTPSPTTTSPKRPEYLKHKILEPPLPLGAYSALQTSSWFSLPRTRPSSPPPCRHLSASAPALTLTLRVIFTSIARASGMRIMVISNIHEGFSNNFVITQNKIFIFFSRIVKSSNGWKTNKVEMNSFFLPFTLLFPIAISVISGLNES